MSSIIDILTSINTTDKIHFKNEIGEILCSSSYESVLNWNDLINSMRNPCFHLSFEFDRSNNKFHLVYRNNPSYDMKNVICKSKYHIKELLNLFIDNDNYICDSNGEITFDSKILFEFKDKMLRCFENFIDFTDDTINNINTIIYDMNRLVDVNEFMTMIKYMDESKYFPNILSKFIVYLINGNILTWNGEKWNELYLSNIEKAPIIGILREIMMSNPDVILDEKFSNMYKLMHF